MFGHNSVVVRVQMLSELEEIIAYKQWHDQPARQAIQRKVWMKRCVFSCVLFAAIALLSHVPPGPGYQTQRMST